MTAVDSIAPVGSSRSAVSTDAMDRIVEAVKSAAASAKAKVQSTPSTKSFATTRSATPSATSNISEGFLLSVGQPTTSNALATTDYRNLRSALEIGNLAAAQQAYLRLEQDLQMQLSQSASTGSASSSSVSTSANTSLNTVA